MLPNVHCLAAVEIQSIRRHNSSKRQGGKEKKHKAVKTEAYHNIVHNSIWASAISLRKNNKIVGNSRELTRVDTGMSRELGSALG